MENVQNIRVMYSDTDAYGVIWHGAYVKWFEVARVEFIEKLVQTVNGLKPDITVLVGDIVDGKPEALNQQMQIFRPQPKRRWFSVHNAYISYLERLPFRHFLPHLAPLYQLLNQAVLLLAVQPLRHLDVAVLAYHQTALLRWTQLLPHSHRPLLQHPPYRQGLKVYALRL